jgi:hypothetical protein
MYLGSSESLIEQMSRALAHSYSAEFPQATLTNVWVSSWLLLKLEHTECQTWLQTTSYPMFSQA